MESNPETQLRNEVTNLVSFAPSTLGQNISNETKTPIDTVELETEEPKSLLDVYIPFII